MNHLFGSQIGQAGIAIEVTANYETVQEPPSTTNKVASISKLLDLPPELRLMIFELLFTDAEACRRNPQVFYFLNSRPPSQWFNKMSSSEIFVKQNDDTTTLTQRIVPAIANINARIRDEALSLYYKHHPLSISMVGAPKLNNINAIDRVLNAFHIPLQHALKVVHNQRPWGVRVGRLALPVYTESMDWVWAVEIPLARFLPTCLQAVQSDCRYLVGAYEGRVHSWRPAAGAHLPDCDKALFVFPVKRRD